MRIFTLGIDQAVNEGFLKRLACLGGGCCELVESEDRLDDVMDRIHRRIVRGENRLADVRPRLRQHALLAAKSNQHAECPAPAACLDLSPEKRRSASAVGGAVGRGGGRRSSQATPIVVNDVLYMPTPYGTVIALEPETGNEIWIYKLPHGRPAGRGVAYWPGDAKTPASILFGTSEGKLMSIDAKTGKPTAGFGDDGVVNIKPIVQNGIATAQFDITSPVTVYKDLVFTGGQLQEAPAPAHPETLSPGMFTPENWSGVFIRCLIREKPATTHGKARRGKIARAPTYGDS